MRYIKEGFSLLVSGDFFSVAFNLESDRDATLPKRCLTGCYAFFSLIALYSFIVPVIAFSTGSRSMLDAP